jgi:hypothetical protein
MPSQVIRFDMKSKTSWEFFRNGRTLAWIGVCPTLKLTAKGETFGDVTSLISEILDNLLRPLLREGTLHEFFAHSGELAQWLLP